MQKKTTKGANDRYRDLGGQLASWDLTPAMGSWYPDKEEVPCDQLDSSVRRLTILLSFPLRNDTKILILSYFNDKAICW